MNKLIIASLAGVALASGSAMAADMPLKAPAAVAPSPAYDWSGFYGSLAGGWERSNLTWGLTHPAPATLTPFSASSTDGIFGGFVGAQYQFSWVVVGVEYGGSELTGAKNASAVGNGTGVGACALTDTCLMRVSSGIQTAGGKLGLAWNQWLFYGEGGWARAQTQTSFVSATGVLFDTTNGTNNGSYVGGGIDWMFFSGPVFKGIIGAEYEHVHLDTVHELSPADGFNPNGVNARNVSGGLDIARVRVTLLMNPWSSGSVVAKY